ncbi:hypothetical protein ACFV6F_40510 [Kitasatospora phosalacinea]
MAEGQSVARANPEVRIFRALALALAKDLAPGINSRPLEAG